MYGGSFGMVENPNCHPCMTMIMINLNAHNYLNFKQIVRQIYQMFAYIVDLYISRIFSATYARDGNTI